jgi:alanyl-tRNA synthetase
VSDSGYLLLDGSDVKLDVVEVLKFGDDQVLAVETGGDTPIAEGARARAVVEWAARFPTMANHTATHLLHAALREVLGDHVKQAGSAVRPDKLRFDFSHPRQLSSEEREHVERLVNEKVFEAIPVRTFVTPIEEARKLGAMMLFGEKYGNEVRVVEIDGFSRELCGGTHVRSTAEIGPFVILSEASVGSGARRIEAVTAGEAWAFLHGRSRELDATRTELERARRDTKKPKQAEQAADVEPDVVPVSGSNMIVMEVPSVGADALLDLSDRFKQRSPRLSSSPPARMGRCTWSRTSTRAWQAGSRRATSSRRSPRSWGAAGAAVRRWRAPAGRTRKASPTP